LWGIVGYCGDLQLVFSIKKLGDTPRRRQLIGRGIVVGKGQERRLGASFSKKKLPRRRRLIGRVLWGIVGYCGDLQLVFSIKKLGDPPRRRRLIGRGIVVGKGQERRLGACFSKKNFHAVAD
jgi:hypothetical protein